MIGVGDLRDTLLRMFPHSTKPGLRRIGNPGRDAPVLVTGNFTLTVRRLERALRGRDVWLLVANSRGINVWCAAGGGHFTHHDVIAAVRASRLADRVDHRRLVLPQLAATGVEPRLIQDATGFEGTWGPARLESLPEFLDRHCKVKKSQRRMTFPPRDRAEMATMWGAPIAGIAALVSALVFGGAVAAVAAAAVLLAVFGLFFAVPWVPITGPRRWLTFSGAAVLAVAAGLALLYAIGRDANGPLIGIAITQVATIALLSVNMSGSTPFYPGEVNSLGNRFHLELVENRCTGAAECVKVCPRDVLQMDGKRRKVRIARAGDCLLCGACIVQCPDDALRFRFRDGRVVEPDVVRTTRLNMLGRRTVSVSRSVL